jgi:uncharacterized protein YndB with AHSA1/START domain
MHRIDTQIEIAASAERVWSILMDFPSHARWNPFIRSIEGSPSIGASLNVSIQPPGSSGMRFRPTVLTLEPKHEFRWKGKLWMRGLFDGEHYFTLGAGFRHSVGISARRSIYRPAGTVA